MAKQKTPKKEHPKRELRNIISGKLEVALADYKSEAGDKNFNEAIKKSSKLLSGLLSAKKKKVKKIKTKKPEETTENTGQ